MILTQRYEDKASCALLYICMCCAEADSQKGPDLKHPHARIDLVNTLFTGIRTSGGYVAVVRRVHTLSIPLA